MTNTHQTQGGKFGANPALSRNCNEIIPSLSQDARRFVYNHVFICEVWMMVSSVFLGLICGWVPLDDRQKRNFELKPLFVGATGN